MKRAFEKLAGLVLAVCFLLGTLSGCAEEEISFTVYDAYATRSADGLWLEYHIPEIMSGSSVFDDINKEIYDFFYDENGKNGFRTIAPEDVGTYDYPFGFYTLTYTDDDYDGILSICTELENTNTSEKRYFVYNILIRTGKTIDDAKLQDLFELDDAEYEKRVREAAASYFLELVDDTEDAPISTDNLEYMIQQYEKTTADENIEQAVPFISEDQLYVAIPIYSVAGADYYWQPLNVSDYTLHEDYGNEFFYRSDLNVTTPQDELPQTIPDTELVEAVKGYYEDAYGTVPPYVEVDHYDGDNVIIHIYDVSGGHISTWDWYTIDRYTGVGTNFMGEEIRLID